MSLKGPCLNCPDRKMIDGKTCHSTCQKYLEFKRMNEEIRNEKNRIKECVREWYEFKEQKFKKLNKRR